MNKSTKVLVSMLLNTGAANELTKLELRNVVGVTIENESTSILYVEMDKDKTYSLPIEATEEGIQWTGDINAPLNTEWFIHFADSSQNVQSGSARVIINKLVEEEE